MGERAGFLFDFHLSRMALPHTPIPPFDPRPPIHSLRPSRSVVHLLRRRLAHPCSQRRHRRVLTPLHPLPSPPRPCDTSPPLPPHLPQLCIPCVVGWRTRAHNVASAVFSLGFGAALAAGKPYPTAFDAGVGAVTAQLEKARGQPVCICLLSPYSPASCRPYPNPDPHKPYPAAFDAGVTCRHGAARESAGAAGRLAAKLFLILAPVIF